MFEIISTQSYQPPGAVIISSTSALENPIFIEDGALQPGERQALTSRDAYQAPIRQTNLIVFNIGVDFFAFRSVKLSITFRRLRDQWRVERGATSSITEMVMCTPYLRIIGMGPAAVPLILREMEDEGDEPDMWFVALQMLTGADPVTEDTRGNFKKMAELWLNWAADNGHGW
jgi:hypothetical protein